MLAVVASGWRLPLACLALLSAAPAASAREMLRALQWNPHWQCFAWNVNNCSVHAQERLEGWLQEHDVDFANAIEFEIPDYVPPAGWGFFSRKCGADEVTLIYNSGRWTPSPGGPATYRDGCMAFNDRPFVLQVFESSNGTSAGLGANESIQKLVVIGAHFPHPALLAKSLGDDEVEALRTALQEVLAASSVDKVLLIADTNEFASTKSEDIRSYLRLPGTANVSTLLEDTCCFDNDFYPGLTFDRVISNFGGHFVTEVLMRPPLPEWAQQVQEGTGRRGAFHLPVLARLHSEPVAPGPVFPGMHRTLKRVFISVVCVLVALLTLWFVHAAMSEAAARRHLLGEEDEEVGETTSSEE